MILSLKCCSFGLKCGCGSEDLLTGTGGLGGGLRLSSTAFSKGISTPRDCTVDVEPTLSIID